MEYSDWLKEKIEVGFYCRIMFSKPRHAHEFRETLASHGLKRIKIDNNADVHFKHDPMLHTMSRKDAENVIKKTAQAIDKQFKIEWKDENE